MMTPNTIWAVMDYVDDTSYVLVAAYDSEALAKDHVDRAGTGDVEQVDVRSTLRDDVAAINPVVAHREREERKAIARAANEAESARLAKETAIINALTIGVGASLCHCTNGWGGNYWYTANGYCRFCGGWTIEVFRERFGEDGLTAAIDLLAHHDRVRMRLRSTTGATPTQRDESLYS